MILTSRYDCIFLDRRPLLRAKTFLKTSNDILLECFVLTILYDGEISYRFFFLAKTIARDLSDERLQASRDVCMNHVCLRLPLSFERDIQNWNSTRNGDIDITGLSEVLLFVNVESKNAFIVLWIQWHVWMLWYDVCLCLPWVWRVRPSVPSSMIIFASEPCSQLSQ